MELQKLLALVGDGHSSVGPWRDTSTAFNTRGSPSGTCDFVTTDDYGQHWSIYPQRDRSFVYEICSDAATPTATRTWGRLKTIYR